MHYYLMDIAAIGLLLTLTWEDLRKKSFTGMLLPPLGVLFLFKGLLHQGWQEVLYSVGINIGAVLVLFGTLFLYARGVKGWDRLLDRGIGKGDLALMAVLTLALSPFNFILFLTATSFIGLLFLLLARATFRRNMKVVPLAGLLALSMSVLLLLDLGKDTSLLYQEAFFLKGTLSYGSL